MRFALTVTDKYGLEEVQQYLPNNYHALPTKDGRVAIFGQDDAGWTMHQYVLPRLGSGMIIAEEVTAEVFVSELDSEVHDRFVKLMAAAPRAWVNTATGEECLAEEEYVNLLNSRLMLKHGSKVWDSPGLWKPKR